MTVNQFETSQRERKVSALIATVLQLAPRPTPDDVDAFAGARWLTLAKIAKINAPSPTTVALTKERYRAVWLQRERQDAVTVLPDRDDDWLPKGPRG